MAYIWIVGACYLVSLVLLVADYKRKNNFAAAQLRANGLSPEKIQNFHKTVNTKSFLLLAWATFFFGSISGAVLSGLYWLVR